MSDAQRSLKGAMSLTTRRTLAWLIGYPMSVAVAAAIIFLPFIYGDFPHPGRNTSLAVVDESAALWAPVSMRNN